MSSNYTMRLLTAIIVIFQMLFFSNCSFFDNVLYKKFVKKSVSLSVASVSLWISPAYSLNAIPSTGQCITDSNPQTTTITCRQLGLTDDLRLRGCKANENCFSTSATSASKRTTPYFYQQSNSDDAFLILRTAIESDGLKILKSDLNNYYLLAAEKNIPKLPSGSSVFYEFLLKTDEKVVLYRGVVDKTVFVYPLQQPISDFDVITNKFKEIFRKTGFYKNDIGTADEYDGML